MTSPYRVCVAPTAREHFLKLSVKHRKMILKVAEALAINPRPPGAQKIDGMSGLYSEAVGQFRLIYKIENQEVWLLLIKN